MNDGPMRDIRHSLTQHFVGKGSRIALAKK